MNENAPTKHLKVVGMLDLPPFRQGFSETMAKVVKRCIELIFSETWSQGIAITNKNDAFKHPEADFLAVFCTQ